MWGVWESVGKGLGKCVEVWGEVWEVLGKVLGKCVRVWGRFKEVLGKVWESVLGYGGDVGVGKRWGSCE